MRAGELLSELGRRLGGRPALVDGDRSLTAAEIDLMSSRMAAALAANGMRKGDCVLVFMDEGFEAIVSIFAILKAGAAFLPVDPSLTGAGLAAIVENNHAAGLVTEARLVHAAVAAMAAAPLLRLTVIAGCEGSPEIDGILRFEDAIAGPESISAASDPEIPETPQAAENSVPAGDGFHRFVAAVERGMTLVLEKPERLLVAAE